MRGPNLHRLGVNSSWADPDMAFFSRSDVTYPVTIDPGTSISINTDTYVENTNPTTTYGTDTRLKSGYDGTKIDRFMIQFAWPSTLNGTHIPSADLSLYEVYAVNCTAHKWTSTAPRVPSTPTRTGTTSLPRGRAMPRQRSLMGPRGAGTPRWTSRQAARTDTP